MRPKESTPMEEEERTKSRPTSESFTEEKLAPTAPHRKSGPNLTPALDPFGFKESETPPSVASAHTWSNEFTEWESSQSVESFPCFDVEDDMQPHNTVSELQSGPKTTEATFGQTTRQKVMDSIVTQESNSKTPVSHLAPTTSQGLSGSIAPSIQTALSVTTTSPAPLAPAPIPEQSSPGAYRIRQAGDPRSSCTVSPVSDTPSLEINSSALMVPEAIPVTAELAADAEAELEKKLRNQILNNVARADVVTPMEVSQELENSPVDLDNNFYRPRNVKERLFGDARRIEICDLKISAAPERCIRKRQLLPSKVKYNKRSDMWTATIQTDQRALESRNILELERGERIFATKSEHEANELVKAMSVPLMRPLDENPICFLCKTKFALFRRPNHCRNCGVVVCGACTTSWNSKMFPETYCVKDSAAGANVCLACDWSARQFRACIFQGQNQKAVDHYRSGNINLRAAFSFDKKEEALFPIHMAIIGGSLKMLCWLVERRCCPLEDPKEAGRRLMTSRGRSPVSLAFTKLDILRYLVGERGVDIRAEKSLPYDAMLAHMSTLLKESQKSTAWTSKKGGTVAAESTRLAVLSNESRHPPSESPRKGKSRRRHQSRTTVADLSGSFALSRRCGGDSTSAASQRRGSF